MPTDILSQYQPEFDGAIEHLRLELSNIRTGRATSAMVENVQVEAYGGMSAIVGLASISNIDNRTLSIDPWDKSLLKAIEQAIIDARVGANPVVTGTAIRLVLPPLTEESRKQLVKMMSEKLEQGRIAIRNIRDEVKSGIQQAEKNKEIDEDAKYRLLEQLDKVAAGTNEKIKHMGAEKETEIMTI